MYRIEIQFAGEWAILYVCYDALADRCALMGLAESEVLLKETQQRYSWPVRLVAVGRACE